MKKIILVIILSFFCIINGIAQKRPPNLPYFDETVVHFGFILGFNQFSSLLKIKDPLPDPSKVVGANVSSPFGYQLGISGELKLNNYFRLRLIPAVCFGDRKFNFNTIDDKGEYKTKSINIEAIYLEVPLEIKAQSKRWRNFRPYVLAGGKYAYDLASLKKKKITDEEMLLKLNNHDWLYTLGAGFDFYLQYFKFGIEIKSSFSFSNLLIPEPHKPSSNIIEYYKTRIFYITFTFE